MEARPAHVHGWARRFWQGSHDHRGVPADPGRVLTVVEAPDQICHGRAFLVEAPVFDHLDYREKNGYERVDVDIRFADGGAPGLLYRAPESNPAFLGPAPLEAMVEQIRRCRGPSGSNREYVVELARALRRLNIEDPHVEGLAARLADPENA